ncbi:MAG: EAL domain-containing protein [Campylobacterota bacterium]|nr:EAL domain-containing protein [Campylobacterota bacterium]
MEVKTLPSQIIDYVIENSSDGFWATDTMGKIIEVNSTYCKLSGYSEAELLSMHISDLEVMESAKDTKAHMEKIIKFKSDLFETKHRKKDGELIAFEVSATYIEDDGGKFIALLRDITEKKEFLNTLERSKENLKLAQAIASIGHWELDLDGNRLYWSDEVYRIFGLQAQEFDATYEAFLEHIHPEDRDLVNTAYSESVENKNSYQITHRVITKQGTLKYVEERCTHIYNSDGEVIRSIGTVHDITRRVESEKKLRLISNVYEYSSNAIIITDQKNKIVSVNRSFEELTGYRENEIISKNPRVLSSGWGDKAFYKEMWKGIHNNGIWKGEVWDRKKNGKLYAASTSIITVKDKDDVVVNYIGISHDITEVKEKEKQIEQLAYYDFLTKLPNRKLFEQEVESYIKSSHYNNTKFAILFLDLDNFKWVNDSLGHHYGDKVLVHVSSLLNAIVSDDAILARIGGDEFVVMTPYNTPLHISQLATKIIESVRYPILVGKSEVNVGWSIGISLFPENATTYDTLLQSADTAMYKAKDQGKNTFKYYSDTMNEIAKRRLELDTRLRYAVDHHEFALAYQPKYSCAKKETIGFEALIRWNDSKLGFVSPDEFIPLAEQSGYIYDIGLWVMKKAFEDLNRIHSQYNDKKFSMAINISGKQLEDHRFLKDVKALLDEYQIQTDCIEFEITETAVMENIQHVISILQEIRALGIKLAIDDFGTGYSSMAYLKKMPLDTLKIDREFISDIDQDNEDRAIVEATIALAKSLKLKTVAEGVETLEHSKILYGMQCDIFQGYFYAKPLFLEELLKFLRD